MKGRGVGVAKGRGGADGDESLIGIISDYFFFNSSVGSSGERFQSFLSINPVQSHSSDFSLEYDLGWERFLPVLTAGVGNNLRPIAVLFLFFQNKISLVSRNPFHP